jgi:hypothetical protein
MDDMRINKNLDEILLRGFIGGRAGRQADFIVTAVNDATAFYRSQGIELRAELYHQDAIKNNLGWSPQTFATKLIESDIHLVGAVFHEGNISKTPEWNIWNIWDATDRLEFHLGYPNGHHVHCLNFRGDKYQVNELLGEEYCLPQMKLDLPRASWTDGFISTLKFTLVDRYFVFIYLITLIS